MLLNSNHLDGEERAGCFALFVFLVSRDYCVALPRGAWGCLRFVIVVFPDHTHYFLLGRIDIVWKFNCITICNKYVTW